MASKRFWLAQVATWCPWHPGLRRPVNIAVDSAVHLSQVEHFPPFDRSSDMQQTCTRAQSLATTPRGESNAPDTSPRTPLSTSPLARDRQLDRSAPLSLRNPVPGAPPTLRSPFDRQFRCRSCQFRSHRPSRPAPSPPTPFSGFFAFACSVFAR